MDNGGDTRSENSDKSEDDVEAENYLNDIDYKMSGLFDKLLIDEKFIIYKDLILELKKSYKRTKCTNNNSI